MHGSRRYPTPCRKGSGPWSDKLEALRLSLRERNADEVMAPGNRASVAARVAQGNREACGQHVVPAPARGAAGLPFVVVGRRAAVGHLAVDRGPATQHARLLVLAQWRAFLLRVVVANNLGPDPELGPVEARIEISHARI